MGSKSSEKFDNFNHLIDSQNINSRKERKKEKERERENF
jgi:hypothetical protein